MKTQGNPAEIPEIRPGQSIELLKELHILTRDGRLNQDTRRKLKQVYHLYQFIEPLLAEAQTLADHGAGKSYLGFILYDLYFKGRESGHIYGIETRKELVEKSRALATRLGFGRMSFLDVTVEDSIGDSALPDRIDVVTALHACNTATDDAIRFALAKQARHIVPATPSNCSRRPRMPISASKPSTTAPMRSTSAARPSARARAPTMRSRTSRAWRRMRIATTPRVRRLQHDSSRRRTGAGRAARFTGCTTPASMR
jgi:hypothetical protein